MSCSNEDERRDRWAGSAGWVGRLGSGAATAGVHPVHATHEPDTLRCCLTPTIYCSSVAAAHTSRAHTEAAPGTQHQARSSRRAGAAAHLVARELGQHGGPEGDDAAGAALHVQQRRRNHRGAAVEEGHLYEAVGDLCSMAGRGGGGGGGGGGGVGGETRGQQGDGQRMGEAAHLQAAQSRGLGTTKRRCSGGRRAVAGAPHACMLVTTGTSCWVDAPAARRGPPWLPCWRGPGGARLCAPGTASGSAAWRWRRCPERGGGTTGAGRGGSAVGVRSYQGVGGRAGGASCKASGGNARPPAMRPAHLRQHLANVPLHLLHGGARQAAGRLDVGVGQQRGQAGRRGAIHLQGWLAQHGSAEHGRRGQQAGLCRSAPGSG